MFKVHFTRSAKLGTGCFLLLTFIGNTQASLLWQIDYEGNTNYILGTIHLADKEIVTLPPKIKIIVNNSSMLVLEIKQDVATQHRIAERTLLADTTLRQKVGKELYQKVAAALFKQGVSASGVQRLKPWAAGLMLNFPRKSSEPVLDTQLQYQFQAQSKPVHALETIDEQLDLFDFLSPSEQIEFLEASLTQADQLDEILVTMKQLYRAGNLDAIQRLASEQLENAHSQTLNKLMYNVITLRNEHMFVRVQPYLKHSRVLIAVGALHLPGKLGILQRLADAGYSIKPVD